MTIKAQAYLQGYLHAKTAAVGLDPNKPIPPNIQKHMGPWTGDTFAEEQRADAISAGNQWPTLPGEPISPGRRPDGSLNWPWAKQWGNPKPLIKGIRDTASGAVADISRVWAGQRGADNIEGIKDSSLAGDIRDVAQHIRKDPVRNIKQMAKDVVYGPGGAWNIAAAALPATWASKIPKGPKGPKGPRGTPKTFNELSDELQKARLAGEGPSGRTPAPEGKEWGRVDPASVVDDPRRIIQPGGQPVPDAARVPGSAARKQFLDKFVEKPVQGIANDILDEGGTPVWSNAHGPDLPNNPQSKGVFYVDAQGVKRFRRHADDLTEGLEATTGYSGGYIIDNPLNKGIVQGTWPGTKPFGHPDWLKEDTGPRMGGHDPADVVRAREDMDRLKRLLDDPDFADKLWSNIDDSAAARAAKNKGPLADAPPGSPIGPQARDVIPEDLDKAPPQVPTSWYDPKVDKRAPGERRPRKSPRPFGDVGIVPESWPAPGKGKPLTISIPNRNPTKTEIDISYGRKRDKVDMDNWWKEPVADASDLKEWQANGYLIERKKFLDDLVEKPLHDMAAELLDADVELLWSNYYGSGPKGVYYVDAKGGRRFRRHPDDLTTGPETSLISHVEDFVGDPEGLIQSLFGPDIAGPAYTPTRNRYTIDNPLTGWN
jgi:hypothetical protein